jgi:predicted metallopeptidase
VLPFVDMECGRVRLMRGDHDGLLGQALGRVAAHEIHHVLTTSGAHDTEGLTKAVFTRSDLYAREVRFAPAAVARMRATLEQRGSSDQRAGAEE